MRWILFITCLFVLTDTHVSAQVITFTLDQHYTAQTIDNIGASGAWFSEGIGRYWPDSVKNRMAELLFSKAFDNDGKPKGIGLSAWRFNIGGGTAEQGDSSGISNPVKRVECFLSPGGIYDWNKQKGYIWFVRKAKEYGVENLIAFSNTPPVQFTKNGLGFKTEKDYTANLRSDRYYDYANFLATVVQHFDNEGLHFNYISPVNEPQWDWSNEFGKMNQEGSPWHNEDIYKVVVSLDSALSEKKLNTRILTTEAGILTALYEGNGAADKQVPSFFLKESPLYIGRLAHLQPVIEGHSYFTDNGDSILISVRERLRDTCEKYGVPFWQSEYSMLGNGYKEGKKDKIPAMDCALFLAKIIHTDLTVANARVWHFWNASEPGSSDSDTRYYLLSLQSNNLNDEGSFSVTKNLWALGHYSRFVRPGMKRILLQRSDSVTDLQAAQNVMVSAFSNSKQMVVVIINYTQYNKMIAVKGIGNSGHIMQYITTAHEGEDMRPQKLSALKHISLPPRSISTVVIALKN